MSDRSLGRLALAGIMVASMALLLGCGRQLPASNTEAEPASGSSLARQFGPMAVIDYDGSMASMASGGKGTVEISERCVQLQLPNDKQLLLVWNTGTAQWEAEDRAVIFTSPDRGAEKIRNGDRISVGGSEIGNAKTVSWLSPPDESCKGERWRVDTFKRAEAGEASR